MIKHRPNLKKYYMELAKVVSTRSSWPGTRVGCILVRDGVIVSTGYNGTPRGYINDLPKNIKNKEYYCHAEENAVVNAARTGVSTVGCVAYVTMSPCLICARILINAGISEVLYEELWEDGNASLKLFQFVGVLYNKL